MSSFRIIKFFGYKICVNDQTYEPAEDTELLLNLIKVNRGEKVVEVGSGSGILTVHSARLGGKVMAIDINPFAVKSTQCTVRLNQVEDRVIVLNCDMLSCVRNYPFDVAIFNPPYLPYEEYDSWISYSWSGGRTGIEHTIRFLDSVKAKRVYTLYSTLSDEEGLLKYIGSKGFKIVNRIEKAFGYESIIALELYA